MSNCLLNPQLFFSPIHVFSVFNKNLLWFWKCVSKLTFYPWRYPFDSFLSSPSSIKSKWFLETEESTCRILLQLKSTNQLYIRMCVCVFNCSCLRSNKILTHHQLAYVISLKESQCHPIHLLKILLDWFNTAYSQESVLGLHSCGSSCKSYFK